MKKCCEAPSGRLLLAVRQFNSRDWFECHETLEEMWLGEKGEVRNFLQGFIQISVALHHWRNGNYAGAVSLLAGGTGYLARVPDCCMWIDVAALAADAERAAAALKQLGKERMDSLDPALIPRVRTVSSETGA